jgi:hypothetical protein
MHILRLWSLSIPSRSRRFVALTALALAGGGFDSSADAVGETSNSLCTVNPTNCTGGSGNGPTLQHVSYVMLTPCTSPDTSEEIDFTSLKTASAAAAFAVFNTEQNDHLGFRS